jgi:hypothetical protein
MKPRFTGAGISIVAALSLLLATGCAYPPQFGACTVVGAAAGGIVGGMAGAAIGNESTSSQDGARRLGAGLAVGLVSGAIIGGLAGHFICDPAPKPPPPAPAR